MEVSGSDLDLRLKAAYDNPVLEPVLGVAVSGNYAYVAQRFYGMEVIDISDPASPKSIGRCGTGGAASRVVLSGDFAFVAANTNGLRIIDISHPANPREVGGYVTSGGVEGVCVSDGYVYLVDRDGLDCVRQ
ncbi:MAG TPA: hypothetical protein VJW76_04480 [Verrucomicrobiae bacterium]|nr:hypothetical protein [Verrucomicrobiae bacterium]